MARIEFEADSIDELVEMARHWVDAYPVPEGLEAVLERITSVRSQRLLSEVAARSKDDEVLVIDDQLLDRVGVADRTALVGVLGVANRTMRRRAHRDLLTTDRETGGYRMATADALVVLEAFGAPPE